MSFALVMCSVVPRDYGIKNNVILPSGMQRMLLSNKSLRAEAPKTVGSVLVLPGLVKENYDYLFKILDVGVYCTLFKLSHCTAVFGQLGTAF